ncbi:MAG: outer membrane beta-barrel domain-containing protein [Bdellovibrionales bacterium]|nr:outer membrane beta-barrel domain-containing protein [Bdellovibrionales bacterium]
MKKRNLLIVTLLSVMFAIPVFARSVSEEMGELGANKKLLERARAVTAKNRIRIVQKRAVDRDLRLETHLGFGKLAGGDPYVDSSQLGINMDFHFTPRWSLGARYSLYRNRLTSEGERIFNDASTNNPFRDVYDYANSSILGTVSWYPLYGKVNMFDIKVVQFDIYTLAGAGQIDLERSGSQPIWTVGGGLGFWLNNHLSSRFEIRYQSYQDTLSNNAKRDIEQTLFTFNIGVLL